MKITHLWNYHHPVSQPYLSEAISKAPKVLVIPNVPIPLRRFRRRFRRAHSAGVHLDQIHRGGRVGPKQRQPLTAFFAASWERWRKTMEKNMENTWKVEKNMENTWKVEKTMENTWKVVDVLGILYDWGLMDCAGDGIQEWVLVGLNQGPMHQCASDSLANISSICPQVLRYMRYLGETSKVNHLKLRTKTCLYNIYIVSQWLDMAINGGKSHFPTNPYLSLIPSCSQTWQLEIPWKIEVLTGILYKWWIFHCHVWLSFRIPLIMNFYG